MVTAYQINRPPTAFSTSPAGKGKRRPRERNEEHLKWIRTLPCVISGKHPVEAAHIRFGDQRFAKRETGMAEKPHDKWTLPLSPDLHRELHSMNEHLFWAKYGIDPCQVAAALYGETGNDEAAEVILSQARALASTMKAPTC